MLLTWSDGCIPNHDFETNSECWTQYEGLRAYNYNVSISHTGT